MKKILITILILLVLILTIFTVVKGLDLGNFEILGIKEIQEKNVSLEKEITEATKLATTEFPSKVSQLNTSMKKLKEEKTNYEDMIAITSTEDGKAASQLTKYNIDFLWTKIGTHATSEDVVIKMDITNGSGASDTYNLNFTVNGEYAKIEEFIRDIEDDSKLGFKIEEFLMKAGTSTSDLQATFVCKDIPIEGIAKASQMSQTPMENETTESMTDTSNVTNSSNTTNVINSTNTTNTTNTTK